LMTDGAPSVINVTEEVRARYAENELREGSSRPRFPAAGSA
jgi:hypothetical protein